MSKRRIIPWGLLALGAIGLAWWLLTRKQTATTAATGSFAVSVGLTPPLTPLRIRSDIRGSGVYGASRTGHSHQGIDLLCEPGQLVRAPFAGTITGRVYPYPSDHRWQGFDLLSTDGRLSARFFYCIPTAGIIGQTVTQGQAIATCQAISTKYGLGMKNHLHLEFRRGTAVVDPTPYFVFT